MISPRARWRLWSKKISIFFLTSCSYAFWPYQRHPGTQLPQQAWNNNGTPIPSQHQLSFHPSVILNASEQAAFLFDPSSIQPVPDVQPLAYPNLAGPLLLLPEPVKPAEAVVMEHPDGKFFCSQLGCDAVYLRAGDCRRHLKMHNGPFFSCKQPGCDMEFYRRDKLRDHMKQGHNIVVAAPRRGRRAARLTANQGSGY